MFKDSGFRGLKLRVQKGFRGQQVKGLRFRGFGVGELWGLGLEDLQFRV